MDVGHEQNNRSQDRQQANARVLGQILAAQNFIFVLPDEARIASFFSEALGQVPGVISCFVCLEGVPPPAGIANQLCSECVTRRKKDEKPMVMSSDFSCGLATRQEVRVIKLGTSEYTFGFFVFQTDESGAAEPYWPFLSNLANYVALSLENRKQRRDLEKARDDLEHKVEERTRDLTVVNADLQREVVERKRAEESLRQLNRELRAMTSFNQTLLRAVDEQTLLDDVCHIVCDEAGYRMAWAGYAMNDDAKTVRPIAWAGIEDGYLASVSATWADTELGHDSTGTAIRTGTGCCLQDIATDSRAAPWRENALKRGYRSTVALPLKDENDITFGALTIYSTEPNTFTPDEIRLLEELAGDLAYGITSLCTRAERKQAEEALLKTNDLLRSIIDAVPAAIIGLDLDGKVDTVWNPAAERMLGWSAQEVMGKFVPTVPVEKEEEHRQFLERIRSGKSLVGVELQRQKRGGTPIDFSIYASPLHDLEGQISGSVAVLVDITGRKRMENALRESESKFRSFVESSSEGFTLADEQGVIIEWNRAREKMTGLLASQVIGKNLWDVLYHMLLPELQTLERYEHNKQLMLNALQTGRSSLFDNVVETEVVRQDGTRQFVRQTIFPIKTDKGYRIGSVTSDITERKRAEEALQRQVRMNNAFFTQSANCFVLFDRDYKIIRVNEAFAKYFGKTAEDFIGRKYDDLYPNDEQYSNYTINLFDEMVRTKQPIQVFNRPFTFVDQPERGTTYWDWTFQPILDKQGEVEFFFFSSNDVTERKRAEETMHLQSTALEATANSIVITDRDGTIRWVNPAFTKMTGYTVEEAIGKTPRILKSNKQDLAFYQNLWNTILSGNVWRGEIINRRKDGSLYTEEMTITPLRQAGGEITHFIATKQDVSQRKQHESEREAIIKISNALRVANTRTEMLPLLLDQVNEMFHADGAVVTIAQPLTGKLVAEVGRGTYGEKFTGLVLAPGEGVNGQVIATGQPYLSNNVKADPTFAYPEFLGVANAIACAPLITQQLTIGALWMIRTSDITEGELRLLVGIADIAANAIRRVTLHEQTEQQLRRLSALHQIDTAISTSLDLRVMLNVLLNNAVTLLGVDAADVLLFNPHTQDLEYAAGLGFLTRSIERTRLRLGQGQAGTAVLERRVLPIPDLSQSNVNFDLATLLVDERFVSHFIAPLIAKGQVKGVFEVFHRTRLDPSPEWLDFLETLATQAAIAIDNATLFDNLQSSNMELKLAYDATIEGWSRALDLRDQETEGHTQRVTEMVIRLAQTLGIRDEELVHIRRGALLHDIGKMGIPDHILLKPGSLTPEERAIMQMHPTYAYELISPIAFLRAALDIPYCHHEKWDGSGYPRGLKGEEIPLAARAFAVVDVWDALRSDRPYRHAWSRDRTYHYIQEQAGIYFDPQVAQVFMSLLETWA